MNQTPLTKIDQIYFKREDLNQSGSAKDRALSLLLKQLSLKKIKQAVISSTGNAAISAQYYCQLYNISLTIFVSPKIDPHKLKLLSHSQVIITKNPLKDSFQYAKRHLAFNLRLSTSPVALTGYQIIGQEILNQLPQVTSIFIPVASGATLLGISQALSKNVRLFAIQPASYCPIASHFDQQYIPENDSITDALSVRHLPLKDKVISASNSGLVIQNQDIISALKYLLDHHISTSNEGALALAGYFKSKLLNLNIGEFPVILLTGTKR